MRRGARLGQHFLSTPWPARALVRSLSIQPGEIALEIGPGKGALTRELLKEGARVIAIEKDDALVAKLGETFKEEIAAGALRVVFADIRDIDAGSLGLSQSGYVLAANIPYYITGEITRQFLTERAQPRAMALLIQKEVASRIVSAKESILSLSVKTFGIPRIIKKVPRGNFSPPPSVDSAIILVDGISRDFFSNLDEEKFFRVVRAGFASKRKFAANNVSNAFEKHSVMAAFETCGIPPKARAEDIPLSQWKCMVQHLL